MFRSNKLLIIFRLLLILVSIFNIISVYYLSTKYISKIIFQNIILILSSILNIEDMIFNRNNEIFSSNNKLYIILFFDITSIISLGLMHLSLKLDSISNLLN